MIRRSNYMEKILHAYQMEALSKIVAAYKNRIDRCTFYMPSGSGVTTTLSSAMIAILNKNRSVKIMILFSHREESLQFNSVLSNVDNRFACANSVKSYVGQPVLSTTYNNYFTNYEKLRKYKFDVIICHNAEQVNSVKFNPLLTQECDFLLGVFISRITNKNSLFADSSFIYEAKNLGFYINEYQYLEKLIVPMLRHMHYQEIEIDKKIDVLGMVLRPDVVATKDGITYYIDMKAYKGPYNDKKVVWNAVEQIIKYKFYINNTTNQQFGIILLCSVDEKLKQEINEEYGIFIWDIKNLLYICNEVTELSEMIEYVIPYSLNGMVSTAPLPISITATSKAPVDSKTSYENELITKLKNCKTGKTKRADQEYEKICSSIIEYLFKSEFSQFSKQHTTNDEIFRMDIICGLKGTTAFWDFLIRYYNTKFVVFECKNYKERLKQNLIYATDKYLFNPALRNVVFIISRNGFSDNAKKAALGILKEQGKLIIDLTDHDLEVMVCAKKDGKEPSDYLLDKVEKLLMGVSI